MATNICGNEATNETGKKSFSVSKANFGKIAGLIVWEDSVNNTVYPSAADFATMSEPIDPPAPPRLSIIICWPKAWPIGSCMMRAITSVPPPGGYGTTNLIGLVGHDWAPAN